VVSKRVFLGKHEQTGGEKKRKYEITKGATGGNTQRKGERHRVAKKKKNEKPIGKAPKERKVPRGSKLVKRGVFGSHITRREKATSQHTGGGARGGLGWSGG